MTIGLVIVSILPVLLLALYIYHKDKNKEPKKLLIGLFLAGVLSSFIAIAISILMSFLSPIFALDIKDVNLNWYELLIHVFIGVALVEETSKWLMSYAFSYKNKEFDEFYDAIIYCAFVSLGFACFENLLYVSEGKLVVGIMRAFLAVPGHAFFGVFMGYYFGLAKIADINNNLALKRKNLLLSILVPSLLHGIYDYCIFLEYIPLILFDLVFVIFLYIKGFKKIKKISSIQSKIKYNDNFCRNCGTKVNSEYCPVCGRKNN